MQLDIAACTTQLRGDPRQIGKPKGESAAGRDDSSRRGNRRLPVPYLDP
jgi:hypothetical protein